MERVNASEQLTNGSSGAVSANRHSFEEITSIVVPTVFALIIVLGFLGNMLVILVITLNKKMRSSTNLLILNLAVADLSFLLICVPFTAYKYTHPVWIFGNAWCKITNYFSYVCVWASVYTLVLMSLDRIFAVVFAVQLPNIRSRRNVTIAIISLWIVVFLANIPALLFHGIFVYTKHSGQSQRVTCHFLDVPLHVKKAFQTCFFVFSFGLPVLILSVLYGCLLFFICNRRAPGNSSNSQKAKRHVTGMVITVVVMFVVCWLPLQMILLMNNYELYKPSIASTAILLAANCLAYMNSCLNPVLYALASTVFREAFYKFLFGKCLRFRRKAESELERQQTKPPASCVTEIGRGDSQPLLNGQDRSDNNHSHTDSSL